MEESRSENPEQNPPSGRESVCPFCGRSFPYDTKHCPLDQVDLISSERSNLVGTTFAGIYNIELELASGFLGTIYRARHALMGRTVAIKVLHPWLSADERALARLIQEAKALTSLDHRNIIKVHDIAVTEKQQAYLVMDDLTGESLAEKLRSSGPMPWTAAVAVFDEVCKALAHAHEHGIIHRGLRPSNIILTVDAEGQALVRLVDFGLAKLVEADSEVAKCLSTTGGPIGSPIYMSPEQCQGKELHATADIYSLGCVMYETLSGRPPFTAATPAELVSKHLHDPPVPLQTVSPGQDIPESLALLVMRSLEKDRVNRFQSARAVSKALGTLGASSLETDLKPASKIKTEPIFLRKMISSSPIAPLLALLVLVLIGSAGWWYSGSAEQGRALAVEAQVSFFETFGQAEDPRLIAPMKTLADFYKSKGDWQKVKGYYRKMIPLLDKKYGLKSPAVLDAMLDEADMMRRLGESRQYAEAIRKIDDLALADWLDRVDNRVRLNLFLRVLDGEEKANETGMKQYTLGYIADSYSREGQYDGAIEYYKRLVEFDAQKTAGAYADGNTISARIFLAGAYRDAGKLLLAEGTYQRALDALTRSNRINVMLPTRKFLEDILPSLARVCAEEGKIERARYFANKFREFSLIKYGAGSAVAVDATKLVQEIETSSTSRPEGTVEGEQK